MGRSSTDQPGAKRVLLHTCCGPCATYCIEKLQPDYSVVLYYANSNIDTEMEFNRRSADAERLAGHYRISLIVDPYDHAAWLRAIAGYEAEPEKGNRCGLCFGFNLERAALYAEAHGFDGFTTTLTVSPHKVSRQIFAAAEPFAGFLPFDFKKGGGFQRSLELAQRYGLYRQDYCGCEFSRRDRE
jgi:predicted adenine nucleotide alpha hydrolase (AANH) superfamily ATPase